MLRKVKKMFFGTRKQLAISALAVFVFFLGFNPFGVFDVVLRAMYGQEVKVVFYAHDISGDSLWLGSDKALNDPEIGPNESIDIFSDASAAMYHGGEGSIIVSSFKLSDEYESVKKEIPIEETIVNTDTSSSSPIRQIENETTIAETAIIDNKEQVPETEVPVDSEANTEVIEATPETEAPPIDQAEPEPEPEVESLPVETLETASGEVEIQEIPHEEATVEIVTPSSGEPSARFFDALMTREAKAVDGESALQDFGEFKSAKAYFSAASFYRQLQEVASTSVIVASSSDDSLIDVTEMISIWGLIDDAAASGTTEAVWDKIGAFSADNISNATNDGYFSFEVPQIGDWDDVSRFKLKLSGQAPTGGEFVFYLDAAWIEVTAEKAIDAPEKETEKRQRWEAALRQISEQKDFKFDENGEIRFNFKKNKHNLLASAGEIFGLGNYWSDVGLNAKLVDRNDKDLDIPLTIFFEDGGDFIVKLPTVPREFAPGRYSIKFSITDNSGAVAESFDLIQDFRWGVLAFNSNKSVYNSGDKAYLQMAVLDDEGRTICDADLDLEIVMPDGDISKLTTKDGGIMRNEKCAGDNYMETPDYSAYYDVSETGVYVVRLTATTQNGVRVLTDKFETRAAVSLDVERFGPTRINPKYEYAVQIKIKIKDDFVGGIDEYLPKSFKLSKQKIELLNNTERDLFGPNYYFVEEVSGDARALAWRNIELKAGDEVLITYVFRAPDISPEMYLLGPLEINSSEFNFRESRAWQIASDAAAKRVKTVMFQAGIYYNSSDTVGQNANTNYTFAPFNFRLAEKGVVVKNAFVVFEAQFEAYANNAGNYSGYTLSFDSCQETCTADAFAGSGRAYMADATVLAYNESESNYGRLLLDVTSEAQLAAYAGDGVNFEGQVGYKIDNTSVAGSSIANSKATLILTYTYDDTSESYTNTVVYPLDSTNGTDRGTRTAVNANASCSLNGNCSIFDYKMDIPDFPGVATTTNRLSQWFSVYADNYAAITNDINTLVNIQGTDTPSSRYHWEAANGGSQGNAGVAFFDNVSGFAENTVQQLEMQTLTTGAYVHYLQGGEVFETYMASSTATTKVRTVSFPIGVINNGLTTALTSKDVDVYFPENGSATGTVKIKSAWVRVISTQYLSTQQYNIDLSTKTGSNATSSALSYAYRTSGTAAKPSFNIIHIIPSTDYIELENANKTTAKKVIVASQNNINTTGGTSAELMITYTYTSEANGYLSNVQLFAGQQDTAPATSTVLSAANSVMPEVTGKTVRGASLLSSHLIGSTDATVNLNNLTVGANLSTGVPVCTNSFDMQTDLGNAFNEYYADVSSAMNTTNNQSYSACYSNDVGAGVNERSKMNGILTYVYQWDNSPPMGAFNSAVFRRDGSGVIDTSIEVDDPDDQDARAKIEYVAGSACNFASPLDPTLDETGANVSADFGDPGLLNSNPYQVGIAGSYIMTASGSNSVLFDWTSKSDIDNAEGTYCLRLTANDLTLDQTVSATTSVYIDNKKPTLAGPLSLNSRNGTSITLNYGATSTETNFREYKIFYKIYDGSAPTEASSVLASSTDANLGNKLFNGKATTTITSLNRKTVYSFAIWAYDTYGNKASSTFVNIRTNDKPTGIFNSVAQKTNGTGVADISVEVDDPDDEDTQRAKLEYVLGSSCDFTTPLDPYLDETQANIQADFGTPKIYNSQDYQVGSSSGWILTSPGSNSVNFDWQTKSYIPAANGVYCLRLTVNDGTENQTRSATSTITLDNVNPATPGALTQGVTKTDSITLIYNTGSPSSDTNPPATNAYKVYYKQAQSGVTKANTEIDSTHFNAYDYNSGTSTKISGLQPDTWYVFNIWAFDQYGNEATSTEIAIKTNNSIVNQSLTLIDPVSGNIAVAGPTPYTFRAVVSEEGGWQFLNQVKLRLADATDNSTPFSDLEFTWTETGNTFAETGTDSGAIASISPSSSSSCTGTSCTLDFKLIFNKNFNATSVDYDAEITSTNDIARSDFDIYTAFYQIRKFFVEQKHYRWRNDDAGG